MRNEKISLVIPVFNEAKIIDSTLETAVSFLSDSFSDFELIISDDGSTDGTKMIVESFPDAHIRCVSHFPNKGKGCAVREGVLAADGNIIVYTDADLAYGIEAVEELVQKLKGDGTDIAIGSRKLHTDGYRDYPKVRLMASRMFSLLTGLLAGFHYDTQCGLKAFTHKAAAEIFRRCTADGFAFDFEAMMYADGLSFSVTQLPVMVVNHRDSKVRVACDSIKMFGDILKIRRNVRRNLNGKNHCT